MTDELVKQAVVRAVQRSYEDWAHEHPSLAAVIDRITLTEHAVESLRHSDAYQNAIEAYHGSRNHAALLDELTRAAGPVLAAILSA